MRTIAILGSHGTVGLALKDRLVKLYADDLLILECATVADVAAHAKEGIDLVVTCLPEDVVRQVMPDLVSLARTVGFKVLDTSAAYRCTPGWQYGLPELPDAPALIGEAQFVANPGCLASGAILLIRPLVDSGMLTQDSVIVFSGLTGYSAGGRKLIKKYDEHAASLCTITGLSGEHKHLPEINRYGKVTPVLNVTVGNFPEGMVVQTTLARRTKLIHAAWNLAYAAEPLITLSQDNPGRIDVPRTDDGVTIYAAPVMPGVTTMVAHYSNLGKGAAGVAVQNVQLMLGSSHVA